MQTYQQKIGKFGEDLACDYLQNKGYQIIERNINVSHGEIDIIARQGKFYVFIEVRTRATRSNKADETINFIKKKNLRKVVTGYVHTRKLDWRYLRIDLIAIDINRQSKIANLKHYRDIL